MRMKYGQKTLLTAIFLVMLFFSFTSYTMAEGLKKVVAVSRFENKTSYSSGGQFDIGNGMADQLIDALIQSGQFVVLERQTLTDVIAEQDMASSSRFQKSKSARKGKLTSAQLLVKGTITEFASKSSGSGAGINLFGVSIGSKKAQAHVGLIIRLIDTTTGQVIDSQRVEGKAESGGLKLGLDLAGVGFGTDSFKKTPIGKATQIAIDNAVNFIVQRMKDIPFSARVIKVSSRGIYIGAGKRSGVVIGDTFKVYSVGEELIDPDTGESLGSEEEEIGQVKVVKVKEKYSLTSVMSGCSGIKKGDIVRHH